MPAIGKLARKERAPKAWYRKTTDHLRAELTLADLLTGLAAGILISTLLLGYRFQFIPDYGVGEIAGQDIHALQDVVYEDRIATLQQRKAAREASPAVYDFDSSRIALLEEQIRGVFQQARSLLNNRNIGPGDALTAVRRSQLLEDLGKQVGDAFSSRALRVLLDQRFSPTLEAQVLKVLNTVLLGGIVENLDEFMKDQRRGIVLRDNSALSERSIGEAYTARSLEIAREYLLQFHLEFSDLSARPRAELLSSLQSLLFPTLIYNRAETVARQGAAAAQVPPVEVHIKQGKAIVRNGEEITPGVRAQLEVLKGLHKPKSLLAQFLGYLFFVSVFLYTLWCYFVHYQERHRKIRNHMVLILVVVTAVFAVVRFLTAVADLIAERVPMDALRDPFNLYYLIPFAFGAILVTLLVDSTFGIIVASLLGAMAGLFYGDIYIAVYALVGNLAGLYSIRQYEERSAIFKAGLTIGLANGLAVLGIDLLRQTPFVAGDTLTKLALAVTSGILAAALSSMLLPALESMFKITTDIRLLELSNLNAPVLRRLSVEAPGTYHHSLMVGTLGETAAEAIGANPLLVRVGAYYHDIGKMLKPEYFMENQAFGFNKHEGLTPSMSCLVISSHVRDGLELARESGLTSTIRDMIPQHHGTRIMTYFYQKAKDSLDDKNMEIADAEFRYPGPKPQSKEAAILMMADSVEAASRTLKEPSPAQIQGMIDRIVDAIVEDDQFDDCDITMKEIRLAKESFLKILTGVYHRRIDYPGYDFKLITNRTQKGGTPSPGAKPAKAV